jgi:hypothetical protein
MIDEKTLTKGQLRKLNALRKSVGDKIGDAAFSIWFKAQHGEDDVDTDAIIKKIEKELSENGDTTTKKRD